jgi:hypothetical protein
MTENSVNFHGMKKFVKEFRQGIKDKWSNFDYELRLRTSAIEMST